MLLLPNNMGRRGFRTTEFWVCVVTEAALLLICLLSDDSAGAGIGAAIVATGYCACRTAFKIHVAKTSSKAVEVAMGAAQDKVQPDA